MLESTLGFINTRDIRHNRDRAYRQDIYIRTRFLEHGGVNFGIKPLPKAQSVSGRG